VAWGKVVSWFKGGWKRAPLLVIEGPVGCGKTFNVEQIARFFGWEAHSLSSMEVRTAAKVEDGIVEAKGRSLVGHGGRLFLFLDDVQLCDEVAISRIVSVVNATRVALLPPILCTCQTYWDRILRPLHSIFAPENAIGLRPVSVAAMLAATGTGMVWYDARRPAADGEYRVGAAAPSARGGRTWWVRVGTRRPLGGTELEVTSGLAKALAGPTAELSAEEGKEAGLPEEALRPGTFVKAGGCYHVAVDSLAHAVATSPSLVSPSRSGVVHSFTASHVVCVGDTCFRPVTHLTIRSRAELREEGVRKRGLLGSDAAAVQRATAVAEEVGGDYRQYVIRLSEPPGVGRNDVWPEGPFDKGRRVLVAGGDWAVRASIFERDEVLLTHFLFENYVDVAGERDEALIVRLDKLASAADKISLSASLSRFGETTDPMRFLLANIVRSQRVPPYPALTKHEPRLRFPVFQRRADLAKASAARSKALSLPREEKWALLDVPPPILRARKADPAWDWEGLAAKVEAPSLGDPTAEEVAELDERMGRSW